MPKAVPPSAACAATTRLSRSTLITYFRRLARRGGVKRIAGTIYEETRAQLKKRLEEVSLITLLHSSVGSNHMQILRNVVTITEHSKRKTVTVTDVSSPSTALDPGSDYSKVIYALRRMCTPVYGFEGLGGSKKTTLGH